MVAAPLSPPAPKEGTSAVPTLENVSYRTFTEALTVVSRFAESELALPAISGVHYEGGPGHLMLVATDRVALIAHRLTVRGADDQPAPDLTGVSGLWSVADIHRALTALKPGRREHPTMRIEFHGHYSSWSTSAPTKNGVPALSVPVPTGPDGFPKWRILIANAIAAVEAPGDRVPAPKFNPARLGQIPGGEVIAHAGTKVTSPGLFTVGTETVVLIMPIRQSEMDMRALDAWSSECRHIVTAKAG